MIPLHICWSYSRCFSSCSSLTPTPHVKQISFSKKQRRKIPVIRPLSFTERIRLYAWLNSVIDPPPCEQRYRFVFFLCEHCLDADGGAEGTQVPFELGENVPDGPPPPAFVQLDELVPTDNSAILEWREVARWVIYLFICYRPFGIFNWTTFLRLIQIMHPLSRSTIEKGTTARFIFPLSWPNRWYDCIACGTQKIANC